jgi:hypothetical protein
MFNEAESLKLLKSSEQINKNLLNEIETNLNNNSNNNDVNSKKDQNRSPIELDFVPDELLGNYKIGDVIGEGFYAKVRECKDLNTGISFALKIIDLRDQEKRVSGAKFLLKIKNIVKSL